MQLIAEFSLQRAGFGNRSVRVKSVVEKGYCNMFFSEYFGFLRRLVADFSL